MKRRILALYREKKFSNHAEAEDAQILALTLKKIKSKQSSFEIQEQEADTFDGETFTKSRFDLVLSMAQGEECLKYTATAERQGSVVINSASAIRNCFRMKLNEIVLRAGLPSPRTSAVSVRLSAQEMEFQVEKLFNSTQGYWIKRGDYHALTDEDVLFAEDRIGLMKVLSRFDKRGIEKVLVQEHILGSVVKFYAVGTGFYRSRMMQQPFRGEKYVDTSNKMVPRDVEQVARRIGKAFGLDVFGTDVVVDTQGKLWVIDVNDWPSFRTCAEEASDAIAEWVCLKI